jgi:hypothetical protein
MSGERQIKNHNAANSDTNTCDVEGVSVTLSFNITGLWHFISLVDI